MTIEKTREELLRFRYSKGRKKGEWIFARGGFYGAKCSVCGKSFLMYEPWKINFCPACGADNS